MGTFWVAARDGLELKTRVEQHAPRCHLDMVSRDRELRKGHTAAGAPDDHAATILRRPVRSSLQDIKANLIAVRTVPNRRKESGGQHAIMTTERLRTREKSRREV